jgi:peroxin-1
MPRSATIQLTTLRTCLVNLPLSLYGPLVEKAVAPQSLVVELIPAGAATQGKGKGKASSYVGWSGMPSSVPGWQQAQVDVIEMDPLLAKELGLKDGARVRGHPSG